MSYIFTKGATSQSIELYIVDSTDGTPETGVLWNTAGIDLKYRRKNAAVVSITEAALTSPALTDTWETGGFLEIGNGVYRLDLPDAALASAAGIDRVVVFGTVTGMVVLPVTIHLAAFDLSTASTPQTADHTAGIADIPTVAEFEARTIVAANYVVVGDTIAGVTLVTTTTTNTDMVGTDSAALATVLGAAVGASISADIAAVKAETASIQTETTAIDALTKAAGDGDLAAVLTDTNAIQGKLPTNKFMGSSDGADDDGTLNNILTDTAEIGAAGVGLAEAGGDGDHLTAINLPNQTMNITGNITGNLSGTVGSVTGAVGSVTGHTNQTGDNFAIVNGAAGLVAIDTVVDAIKVITDALTAAAATKLALAASTMITGIVSWDNTNATTTVIYSSDITEATADHFNGRLFVPTSGALVGQYTEITDYALDTGEGKFTVTAMTEPPADNSTFVIL